MTRATKLKALSVIKKSKKSPVLVTRRRSTIYVDTNVIAALFDRRHSNVIKRIDQLIGDGSIDVLHLEHISYLDSAGRAQLAYRISERDALVLMPFLGGKLAVEGQAKLVDAFMRLRNEISLIKSNRIDPEWLGNRQTGKTIRHQLADTVKSFVEYAIAQGSSHAQRYYTNITNMEYAALFMIDAHCQSNLRDRLTGVQLAHLTSAETIATNALRDGMAANFSYKDIYKLAKQKVEDFAKAIGKSSIVTTIAYESEAA
jgi:phage regulator Rha-like protein